MAVRPSRELISRITITFSRYWFPRDASGQYTMSAGLFVRVLALIYFFQFLSLSSQVDGLLGSGGILPVNDLLQKVSQRDSLLAILRVPTLFWYGASDFMLHFVCWVGILSSITLLAGFHPFASSIAAYLCFLSFASVGGDFFSFLGDHLLLEAGLITLFLTSFRSWVPFRHTANPPWLVRFAFCFLLFRVHFFSAISELFSGLPFLDSLSFGPLFHQNQPLPSQAAWVLHQLPDVLHWFYAFSWLALRLVGSFFLFGSPRARRWTALAICLFQGIPFSTGGYSFFSLLIVALCLLLVDDGVWVKVLPFAKEWIQHLAGNKFRGIGLLPRRIVLGFVLFLTLLSALLTFSQNGSHQPPIVEWFSPFGVGSSYAFSFSPEESRPELRVEGSLDGKEWQPYRFRWKPESPSTLSPGLFLHHPRLDWQMANAARTWSTNPDWVNRFCQRLLEGFSEGAGLSVRNPFSHASPRFVRFRPYAHRFTDLLERREGWWKEAPPRPETNVPACSQIPGRSEDVDTK